VQVALVAAALGQAAVLVPAGEFRMGAEDGDADERPLRTAAVAAFRIDRTEVTNRAYAACVEKRRCRSRAPFAGTDDPDQPVVGVSWDDATRYCRFARGRLPSEAEWEKAARGTDGRRYPWGDGPDCRRANFGNFLGSGPCPENPGFPERVGTRPDGASPYGALDMAGNVWEWVKDAYPGEAGARVLRGGGCCGYFSLPRTSERLRFVRGYRDRDIGFRCAYDVRRGAEAPAEGRTRRAAPRPGAAARGRAPRSR
jgi:formylglycine-generating enzyme required for sulfatase activity